MTNAVIGYDNILTQQSDGFSTISVTANSEAAGFEVENCFDWNTYDFWKPAITGNSQIVYDNNNVVNVNKPAPFCDYVAFYAHNFSGSQQSTVAQVFSGAGAGVAASAPIRFLDSKPKMVIFDEVQSADFRIVFYPMQNRVLWSQEFDNAAWIKDNVSVSANTTQDINGGLTADTLTVTSTVTPDIRQTITTFASGNVTASCYVKKGTADRVDVYQSLSGGSALASGVRYNFDTDTLTDIFTAPDLSGRDIIGNGWVRVWFNVTDTGSNTAGSLIISTSSAVPAIGDSVVLWQPQWEHSPIVNKPVFTTSASVTSFSTGQVGVVMLGKRLDLPLNMTAPFNPPKLAYDDMITNVESDTGQFIGRAIRRLGSKFMINMPPLITPEFAGSDWDTFIRHARTKPFMFAWDIVNHPTDIVYSWTDGNISVPSYSNQAFMQVGLNCRGLTE